MGEPLHEAELERAREIVGDVVTACADDTDVAAELDCDNDVLGVVYDSVRSADDRLRLLTMPPVLLLMLLLLIVGDTKRINVSLLINYLFCLLSI